MSTKNDKTNDDLINLSKQLLVDFGGIEILQDYWFSHSRRQIDREFQEKYNCSYYYAKKIFNNIFGFRDRLPEEFVVIQHQNMDKTNLERYGRTNIGQFGTEEHSRAIKEKYDVNNISQANKIKEKTATTNLERYGVICVLQNNEIIEKSKQTWLSKYGVDNPLKSDTIKEKIKQTCLAKWGVENPYQAEENKLKIRKTCFDKYSVENIAQSHIYHRDAHKKYLYDNAHFDSSWELALYIYAKDHNEKIIREPIRLSFIVKNKLHYYFPDFLYKDRLIEIKGSQFLTEKNELKSCYSNNDCDVINAKYQCMLDNDVEIWPYKKVKFALDYIKQIYGKDYLKQFKRELEDGKNNDGR